MSTTESENGGTLTLLPGGEESSIISVSPQSLGVVSELVAQFKCSECAEEGINKQLKNAAGLAKHRSAKHGITGSRNTGAKTVRRTPKAQIQPEIFPAEKFLKLMFPEGIPSNLSVISEINDWATHSENLWNNSRKFRK